MSSGLPKRSAVGTRMRPWASVDGHLTDVLLEDLPGTIDATILAIRGEVPNYRDFASGAMAATVRRGVEIALERLLRLLGQDEPALDPRAARLYELIGAGEWRQGRSLEAVLAAYRTGARVAWERMSATALAAGVPAPDLVSLAEAIFVYIDELSAVSAQGHARAQADDVARRDLVRTDLARLLLAGGGRTEPAQELAEQARWTIPEQVVAIVVVDPGAAAWPPLSVREEVLVADMGDQRVGLVAAPGFEAARFVGQAGIAVGTPQDVGAAARSMASAVGLAELVGSSVVELPVPGVLLASDHLLELALRAGDEPLADLAVGLFAPLEALAPGKREALLGTLHAWLALDGDRSASARHLHVHPQTVSYRMARVRELLPGALQDPRTRLAMLVALSAARGVIGAEEGR